MTAEQKKYLEEEVIKPGKETLKKFNYRSTNGYVELAIEAYEKEFGKINWYE